MKTGWDVGKVDDGVYSDMPILSVPKEMVLNSTKGWAYGKGMLGVLSSKLRMKLTHSQELEHSV